MLNRRDSMTGIGAVALAAASALHSVTGAVAATPGITEHTAATVFIQSCMQHAGNPASLRDWIAANSMRPAPDDASRQYLAGRPGRVFGTRDAAGGAVVIVSFDDGGCSMILEHAEGLALRQVFEGLLTDGHATFKITHEEHEEQDNPRTHLDNHAYEVANSAGTRKWRVVITTAEHGSRSGRAILTAYPLPVS